MRLVYSVGAVMGMLVSLASGGEIEFVEDFALARDRSNALKQLIPGTEDYYYYHALHYLNTEQFAKVRDLFPTWHQRHGQSGRLTEIQTRLAMLSYDQAPQETLNYLRQRLNLTFSHQREQLEVDPRLPTRLDPATVSRASFLVRANAHAQHNVDAFEDTSFDWLVTTPLDPHRRRSLLSRLQRPDVPNLVKLVAEDLAFENSGGFHSLGIHQRLLQTQLEELLKLRPELLNQQHFVTTYLARLQPTADEPWQYEPALLQAYLERLEAFVNRLGPMHNSLKAHVLFHRLVLDQKQGKPDKARFLAYLKLPRRVGYLSRAMQESAALRDYPSDLTASPETLLPPVQNDEPLVRSLLAHFLRDAASPKDFEPYIHDVYLKHLFAETKILNGLGDAEQWASQLPPELFQQLKTRIDIDFDPANQTQFQADEPVRLDLHIKNVNTLIVKVFEINTRNYYREHSREVDTDINLDGLVANFEKTFTYEDSPLRRIARTFEFPQLNRPGVYVIDLIGNGRSSRALVRKGRLKHLVRTGAAGQVFTILDDRNQRVNDATVWLGGHEYPAGKDGTVAVPFSTAPGRQPIVISRGDLSSLDHFIHEAENYTLAAGLYVDRESLLRRKTAELVVRPGLFVNGALCSLKLLEDVKLVITSTDLDGIASSQELRDFQLFEDRESTHEFQVPPRLASIQFLLQAQVTQVSTGQKVQLSASQSFSLNEIDRTEKIEDLHLLRSSAGYVIELRGKTGESRGDRPIQLVLKHRDFRHPLHVTLKTDGAGRVGLGALTEITTVTATGPEGLSQSWTLRADAHTYSQSLHGLAGQELSIPYLPAQPAAKPVREEVSLLEVRGGAFVADRFEHLAVQNGLLVLQKLPAGDYDLLLKASQTRIRVRITEGTALGQYLIGRRRQLESPVLKPVQIESITPGEAQLTIQLRNASRFTRVHVFATRYVPEYSAYHNLSRVRGPEPYAFSQTPALSVYLTGRNIGDEYRYIIDRRYASRYPGNMLERPSLLLNPWAVRDTETGEQGSDAQRAPAPAESAIAPAAHLANLDFLRETSALVQNLVPNEQGVILVKNEALGGHQHLHVIAVDPLNTTYRSVALPEPRPEFVDLRLLTGLDPKNHFTQQKQVTLVPAGQEFTLSDISTSRFESYDTLARVYGLYATLNRDPKLVEFSFIVNWPTLTPEAKRELYSKHASHELSFFLSRKDPEFFKTVILPYLANKKDQTFLDHYLLGHDLSSYLLPWNHEQLNIVERILLAQRVAGEQPRTARHVKDLNSLLPPNVDGLIRLFETAVQRSALETDDQLGLRSAVEAATAVPGLQMFDAPAAAPANGALGAAAANGPRGGAALSRQVELQLERKQTLEKAKKESESRDGKSEYRKRISGRRDEADKAEKLLEESLEMDVVAGDRDSRAKLRQLYRKLEKTREWAENNYYHLTIDQQNGGLVTVNGFWADYAQHDPEKPFLSRHFAEASRNFPEMLLALAVLDLPFEAEKHESRFDGNAMTFVPGSPAVVFHEELRPAAAAAAGARVLVSQNFFRHGDRTRQENGETIDKYVTEEFLVHTVYGCQVVITNPTSARQKLSVLLQIPEGALPVLNSQATRTIHLNLEPYHTQTVEYHFYFPTAGQQPHFPVHVARNETLIASAAPVVLNVVDKPTRIDTRSWDYVSQQGSTADVLAFLDENNVHGLNLDRIAWRMGDPAVFQAVISRLAARHLYHHTLWSYALKHNVVAAAREFLQHVDQIVNECGGRLDSPLLTVDLVQRRVFEHLEYKPLVNARAHALGKRRQIVNDRQHWQYHRLLKELSYTRELDDEDLLAVTYHLLLQDRLEDALPTFERVNRDKVQTRMQYDYCAAYLDFFTDGHEKARAIAAKYVDYPVDRWRNTFAAITAQLDEAEGKAPVKTVDPEDRGQQQTALAATEPNFDLLVEARQITLSSQNLDKVRVNFYEMDVELLFSRNPFVQQFSGQFSSIRPNLSIEVALNQDKGKTTLPLPAALQNRNVLVEVVGGGLTRSQAYYSHDLSVQVIDTYGQVKITHEATGKPVPKAYVKVYAQQADGQVKFYKDGYTDLRGRFDYASLSTGNLDQAEKFSILILSESHGALVKEATPPKQ